MGSQIVGNGASLSGSLAYTAIMLTVYAMDTSGRRDADAKERTSV